MLLARACPILTIARWDDELCCTLPGILRWMEPGWLSRGYCFVLVVPFSLQAPPAEVQLAQTCPAQKWEGALRLLKPRDSFGNNKLQGWKFSYNPVPVCFWFLNSRGEREEVGAGQGISARQSVLPAGLRHWSGECPASRREAVLASGPWDV